MNGQLHPSPSKTGGAPADRRGTCVRKGGRPESAAETSQGKCELFDLIEQKVFGFKVALPYGRVLLQHDGLLREVHGFLRTGHVVATQRNSISVSIGATKG